MNNICKIGNGDAHLATSSNQAGSRPLSLLLEIQWWWVGHLGYYHWALQSSYNVFFTVIVIMIVMMIMMGGSSDGMADLVPLFFEKKCLRSKNVWAFEAVNKSARICTLPKNKGSPRPLSRLQGGALEQSSLDDMQSIFWTTDRYWKTWASGN